MASLTLVVLTRNEASRLERCLASCRGVVDDVVVVDSESTDGTVAVAEAQGARVFVRPFAGRAEQSRFAREQVTTDWFLYLDGDEALSAALGGEIRSALADPPATVQGYTMDRLERFLGRDIRCGRHNRLLRLVRTDVAQMPFRRAHAGWEVPGPTVHLGQPMLHVPDQPLDELMTKLTQRGLLSAQDYHDAGRRSSYAGILWHPLATFIRLWLLKGGCFDGVPGLIFCGMRSCYCFTRMAYLHQLQQSPD